MSRAIDVFISYSHRDRALCDELEKHLGSLKREGVIRFWTDHAVTAGDEWEPRVRQALESADMVLLLVSPDYLSSDVCGLEMKRAIARHHANRARVIPIILRPVDWKHSFLAALSALPKDGHPIATRSNQDEAFLDVVSGIRRAVGDIVSFPPDMDSQTDKPEQRLIERRRVAVCFVDIRDFGLFSGTHEPHIDHVLSCFSEALSVALAKATENVEGQSKFALWIRGVAQDATIKPQGPGVAVVWEESDQRVAPEIELGLALFILDFVSYLQDEFQTRVEHLRRIFYTPRLQLAIGLSRGYAWKVFSHGRAADYVGDPIKIAARLMDKARPYGLVADLRLAPSVFMERCCAREGQITQAELDESGKLITVWATSIVRWRRSRRPNTLQEALKLLTQYHDRGSRPSPLTEDDTKLVFDAREEIEAAFAADLATRIKNGRVSADALVEMKIAADEMSAMLDDGTIPNPLPSQHWAPPEHWGHLGVKFHAEIARLSDSDEGPQRQSFTEAIYKFARQSYSAATSREELERVVTEHREILSAIKGSEVGEASRLMRRHLNGHYERERKALLTGAPSEERLGLSRFDRKGKSVPTTSTAIDFIARQGITLVDDPRLRRALDSAYESIQGKKALAVAHQTLRRLVSYKWSTECLCHFLSGWRATHGTSLFISGLIVRIHRKASEEQRTSSRAILFQAAGEVGEIIIEDTGVNDTPHNELFMEFANQIVGDDRWQLGRYSLPVCEQFRTFVKNKRLGGVIEEAILTTAASENWNSGEYTYFNGLVAPWMTNILGHAFGVVERKSLYVSAHAGVTELGHFIHALRAWKLYCEATGVPADPGKAENEFKAYLEGVGSAFEELGQALRESV